MTIKQTWLIFALFTIIWVILYAKLNPIYKSKVLPISYVEAEVISKNIGIQGKRKLYTYCVFNSNNHTMVRDCPDNYVVGEKYWILTDEYMLSIIKYGNFQSFFWGFYGFIALAHIVRSSVNNLINNINN
jgi:hypothetical protein